MDGEFVPWAEARVHVLTHSLHYGLSIFEGLRAYQTPKGPAIFRLREHIERLFRSAQIVGLSMPFDRTALSEACRAVVRNNALSSCYIRPLCFYGADGMGLHTEHLRSHVMVAAWAWEPYLGEEGLRKGIRIKTASFRRQHSNSALCKAKASGNYIISMLALQEARMAECEEALLLDNDGFVAEGSGENIFLVHEGQLATPDSACILDGITRRSVITLAGERGWTVQERRITRDEVYTADEVFLTGTAAELTPVREVDGRRIGPGEPGAVTRQLQTDFFAVVRGERTPPEDWLSHV